MPHANIWIRKEDEEKWERIPNKSEFIHIVLNGPTSEMRKVTQELADIQAKVPIVVNEKTARAIRKNAVDNQPTQVCEHFQSKGSCLQKGCKYSRL